MLGLKLNHVSKRGHSNRNISNAGNVAIALYHAVLLIAQIQPGVYTRGKLKCLGVKRLIITKVDMFRSKTPHNY